MNRRTRTLIVMVIAVVCATLASVAVFYASKRAEEGKKIPPQQVIVAARSVTSRSCLSDGDIAVAQWPAEPKVAGVYSSKEDVLGRAVRISVVEGEPLTEAKILEKGAGCGLEAAIEKDMRAISVKVNEVIGVAGFVVPGAKVDVVVTIRQDSQSMSRVVVSNVMVLTAGTALDEDKGKEGKAMPASVVTLMVTPAQAERIALAATEGQILLTLRSPLNDAETRTSGVRTPDIFSDPRPKETNETKETPKGETAAPTSRGRSTSVVVIRAGRIVREVVQ